MFICESNEHIFYNEISVESCVLHASNTIFKHSLVQSILILCIDVLFLVLCFTKTIDNNLITTLIIKRVMKMKVILIKRTDFIGESIVSPPAPCIFISFSDRIFKVF